jgi:LysR family transcriptional regulator, nod-box dependent transcriptional activator
MRLNKFDLNLLVALDALLREKSVTRAAERLFLSQPAMSAALSRLREYFDNPLLVRVGREMELTSRAMELREPVQQMLLNAHAVLGGRSTFDAAIEHRTFTVLCSDNVSPWVMPGLLRRLQHEAPGIRIEVERPGRSGLALLTQGDVDLFLSLDPLEAGAGPVLPESVCRAPIVNLRHVCVRSIDHPDIGEKLTQAMFLQLPFVMVRQGRESSHVEEAVLERFGVQLDIRAVTENVLELPFLITRGSPFIGVTLEPLAWFLRSSPRLRIMEIPPAMIPDCALNMLWHRSLHDDGAHAWLRDVIRQECVAVTDAIRQGR